MKKLVLIALSCTIASATVFGQEVRRTEDDNTITIIEETQTPDGRVVTTTTIDKNRVFTNGFSSNWEVVGGLGVQAYMGENDRKVNKFTENFSFPAIDLFLTKWASPTFGVGIGASGIRFSGLYQGRVEDQYKIHFKTDEAYDSNNSDYDYYQLRKQKGYFGNLFVLAHTDLGNLFGGYDPARFFTIDAYAGGGVIFGVSDKAWGASFNAGLINKFRLTDRLSLMLNIRGTLVSDDFDGESSLTEPDENHYLKNIRMDGLFGGTLGLAWKIGKNGNKWENATRTSTIYYNDAIYADRDRLANELANRKPEIVKETTIVKDTPDLWFHINFIIDKWDILKREHINLESVADIMKSTPNTKYLLVGYADKQTATAKHNLMLSENRVKAVYDVRVNPDQLVTDYKGGVDYMFYDEKEFSRCVMISTIKED